MPSRTLRIVLVVVLAILAGVAGWAAFSISLKPVPAGTAVPEPAVERVPVEVRDAGLGDAGTASATPEAAASSEASEQTSQRGTAYLITSLRKAKAFRARARAAILLGRRRSPRVTTALVSALRDTHPAVRTAAAESLRRVGTPQAVAALRLLESSEKNPDVRRALVAALARAPGPSSKPTARVARAAAGGGTPQTVTPQPTVDARKYYVGVSPLADPRGALNAAQSSKFSALLRRRVGGLADVSLAPPGQSPAAARKVLAAGATGYYVTASVTRLEFEAGSGMKAAVSLMVGTYPGRNMRAIVNGSVTLPGAGDTPGERDEAMGAAVASAVRKLPPAFARSRE